MDEPVRPRVPAPSIDPAISSQGNWLFMFYLVLFCIGFYFFRNGKQIWRSPFVSPKDVQELENRLKKRFDEMSIRAKNSYVQSTFDAIDEMWSEFSQRIAGFEVSRIRTQRALTKVQNQLEDQLSDNCKALSDFQGKIEGNFQRKVTRELDTMQNTILSIQDQAVTQTQVAKLWEDLNGIEERNHEIADQAAHAWEEKLEAQKQRDIKALNRCKFESSTALQEALEKNNAGFEAKLQAQEQRRAEELDRYKNENSTALQEALKKSNADMLAKLEAQEQRGTEVLDHHKFESLTDLQSLKKDMTDIKAELKKNETRVLAIKSQATKDLQEQGKLVLTIKSQTAKSLQEQENRHTKEATKQMHDLEVYTQEEIKKGSQEMQEKTATQLQEQKKAFEVKFKDQESEITTSLRNSFEQILQSAIAKQESKFEIRFKEQEAHNKNALDAQDSEISKLRAIVSDLEKYRDTAQKKVEGHENRFRTLEEDSKAAQSQLENFSALDTTLTSQANEIKDLRSTNTQLKADVETLRQSTISKEEFQEQTRHTSDIEADLAVMSTRMSTLQKQHDDAVSKAKIDNDALQQKLDETIAQADKKVTDLTNEVSNLKSALQEQVTEQSELKNGFATLEGSQEIAQKRDGELAQKIADFEAALGTFNQIVTQIQTEHDKLQDKSSEFITRKTFDELESDFKERLKKNTSGADTDIKVANLDQKITELQITFKSSGIEKIKELHEEIAEVTSTVTTGRKEQEQKFLDTANQMASVKNSLIGVETQVAMLAINEQQEQKFSDITNEVHRVKDSYDGFMSQCATLTAYVEEQGHKMSDTETTLKDLAIKIEQIDSNISTGLGMQSKKSSDVENSLKTMEDNITKPQALIDQQLQRLDKVEDQFDKKIEDLRAWVTGNAAAVENFDALNQKLEDFSKLSSEINKTNGDDILKRFEDDESQLKELEKRVLDECESKWKTQHETSLTALNAKVDSFTKKIMEEQGITAKNNATVNHNLIQAVADLKKRIEPWIPPSNPQQDMSQQNMPPQRGFQSPQHGFPHQHGYPPQHGYPSQHGYSPQHFGRQFQQFNYQSSQPEQ